jgi:hypothetical protein
MIPMLVHFLLPAAYAVSAGVEPAGQYTFGFWPKNPRLVTSADDYRFAVQTDQYGMLLNVGQGKIERLGPLPEPLSESEALTASNDRLKNPADLAPAFWIERLGRRYYVVSAGVNRTDPKEPVYYALRLHAGGKHLQHLKLVDLLFADSRGEKLESVTGSIDLVCWPDFIVYTLTLESSSPFQPVFGVDLPPVGKTQSFWTMTPRGD